MTTKAERAAVTANGRLAELGIESDASREHVRVSAPKLRTAAYRITGTAPYVQSRFSYKAQLQMEAKQLAGDTTRKGKKRDPRDFEDDYKQSQHVSTEGWLGMPVGSFRAAMIDACRLVGYRMTYAKLSVFVEADGIDAIDGTPLVRIVGDPEMLKMPLRNDSGGATIRVRTMWRAWSAVVRVRFDEDQFTLTDATNLLMRVGEQVGVGEGRPNSRNSAGCGWGTFTIEEKPA